MEGELWWACKMKKQTNKQTGTETVPRDRRQKKQIVLLGQSQKANFKKQSILQAWNKGVGRAIKA